MLVTGLATVAGLPQQKLDELIDAIGVPQLSGCLQILEHEVNRISGWRAQIELPHEHAHRNLESILTLIENSQLTSGARVVARRAFEILAEAEAKVHNMPPEEVTFHEVGALDSILDTCLAAALLDHIAPEKVLVSPLPLCDGVIKCAHGLVASPAPAVQEMLKGVPVYGIDSQGETVTPTAIAFLLAADASFGKWPEMTVNQVVRAYGGKILSGVPNGALFALGE